MRTRALFHGPVDSLAFLREQASPITGKPENPKVLPSSASDYTQEGHSTYAAEGGRDCLGTPQTPASNRKNRWCARGASKKHGTMERAVFYGKMFYVVTGIKVPEINRNHGMESDVLY